jgi:hypothetical protein
MWWQIAGVCPRTKIGRWPKSVLPVQEVGNPCTGKMLKGLVLNQMEEYPKVVGE